MIKINQKIKLIPASQKGKQRIKKFGQFWHVIKISDSVQFPTKCHGPFLFIKNQDVSIGDDSRWIAESNDINFSFELI